MPLNYVERIHVDNKLVDSLSRRQHIAIYGSSKQGKTSLRQNCLKTEDVILIQCSGAWQMENIFENILKQAGIRLVMAETENKNEGFKTGAKMNIKLGVVELGLKGDREEGGGLIRLQRNR